jgi:hypothetical protein
MVRSSLVIASLALALLAAGCGGGSKPAVNPNAAETSPLGDIPDNQAYVAYTPPGGGYSVKVPEGWARTASGGAVTFTDKLNSIRVESVAAKSAPTVAEAKRVEVPKLAQSVKGFKSGGVSSVDRTAGKAIRIKYLADASADTVTGKTGQDAVERYVFFHKGKDAVLTLSGPKGADNVDPWKIITDSVRWSG